jgi:hypothetical protein
MTVSLGGSGNNLIVSGGNVGIGTTNPLTNTHIAGSNGVTDSFGQLFISTTNTATQDFGGQITLGGFFNGTSNQTAFGAIAGRKENSTANSALGYLSFATQNGTITERMRITSGGDVGIGTSTPNIYGFGGTGRFLTVLNPSGYAVANIISNGTSGGGIAIGNETIRRAAIEALNGSDLAIYTNGTNSGSTVTERMRITSGGNVGIGTTTVRNNGANQTAIQITGLDYPLFSINGTSTGIGLNIGTGSVGGYIGTYTNHPFTFATNDTERMRITSGGNVCIGSSSASGRLHIEDSGAGNTGLWINNNTFGHLFQRFSYQGSVVGSISYNGSNTVYATTSDYRLKEDLRDFNGLSLVNNIDVYDYKWKSSDSRSYGVMAHELQNVLPDAVIGEKDGEDMQGVDYSKIVPVLVKAIQELTAKVEQLENNK